MTTVRFEIFPDGEGTKLVMSESGFDRLPDLRRSSALESNTAGWASELGELEAFVNEGKRQPTTGPMIFKERIFAAPIEKVWNAIATGEGLSSWFSKRADGVFAVGEMVVLTLQFSGDEFEAPFKVVEYEPMSLVSWLWHPGQPDGCKWDDFPESEATLVKFKLAEVPGGTQLKLYETGFENIPESRMSTVLGMNQEGWGQVYDMLEAYLTKS